MLQKRCRAVALGVFLSLVSCNSPNTPADTSAITPLKINNGDIAGWSLGNFAIYKSADLFNAVDGGAIRAQGYGVIDGAKMLLIGPADTLGPVALIYDFATTDSANSMYAFSKSMLLPTDIAVLPGFDTSVAIGDIGVGTFTAYAHFGKFYFELPFKGPSSTDAMIQEALLFLNLEKARIH
jgi:hypothetical protein